MARASLGSSRTGHRFSTSSAPWITSVTGDRIFTFVKFSGHPEITLELNKYAFCFFHCGVFLQLFPYDISLQVTGR
jgi:hypothetical protein